MQVVYDWGAKLAEQPQAIQWGFWYSDVEHYISKVTSGSRITLSYSIHGSPARIERSPVDYTATPFGTALLILTSIRIFSVNCSRQLWLVLSIAVWRKADGAYSARRASPQPRSTNLLDHLQILHRVEVYAQQAETPEAWRPLQHGSHQQGTHQI